MRPVTALTIVYDATCGLCGRVKDWILQQSSFVSLEFIATGSPEAGRYPQLPPGELAVVANTGEVWLGNRAWIVCLWALRDYRDLAFRFTSPLMLPLAREAFSLVSRNRAALSAMLSMRDNRELAHHLKKEAVPQCQSERY